MMGTLKAISGYKSLGMVRIKTCLSNLRQLKLIFALDASELNVKHLPVFTVRFWLFSKIVQERDATVRAMQPIASDWLSL